MAVPPIRTQDLIDALVRETGADDPVSAIRLKSMQAIESYVACFGEPDTFPLDLLTLASFLGIKTSNAIPVFSPDAELAPDGEGGVEMHVNPDRPETRQRFSIGHEITHTFFPDHKSHVWSRADSRYRDLSDANDYLEMLCDVGAAELVFPRRWFVNDAAGVDSAAKLVNLALKYKASREATVRRYAELHAGNVAAVFFSWKLKPTQKCRVGREDEANIFGISSKDEIIDTLRLRIDYAIPSPAFAATGRFLPRDKSVESKGELYNASATGHSIDGDSFLDLGQASGQFHIQAVPLWTSTQRRGPKGENAVAAIIRPLDVWRPKKKVQATGPSLFD